uniref:Uncharacterized protein n=1 Tax=Alexandrium monilatum TaxID=311494 RepID=A0A7S4Q176_9DINO
MAGETPTRAGHSSARRAPAASCAEHALAIALDPAVVHILHRRGGRRLHALRSSSRASVQLDRGSGVLYVSGSEETLYEVQRQLSSLQGPRRKVSELVWNELMRTRTRMVASQPHEGFLAWLQRMTGCHVHVERDRREVRLFGTDSEVEAADELLQKMAQACCRERVEVPVDAPPPDAMELHMLAQHCGVTLCVGVGYVEVMGLQAPVVLAKDELQQHFEELRACYVDPLPDFTLPYVEDCTASDPANFVHAPMACTRAVLGH